MTPWKHPDELPPEEAREGQLYDLWVYGGRSIDCIWLGTLPGGTEGLWHSPAGFDYPERDVEAWMPAVPRPHFLPEPPGIRI